MAPAQDNRAKAIAFAVLLHLALVAILVLGIEFSDYRPLSGPKVDIVEAEIVATPLPVRPRVDPEAEQRQLREAAEAARQRQAEERDRQQQAEARRKQAELETQKKNEATRQKAEQEAKRKAEQETRQKAEQAARKKAEQEARAKAEADARQKAEAEARAKADAEARRKAEAEQQAREKALQEALAQEQRERELSPLSNAYISAISQKIARNWNQPVGISKDLRCELSVTQLPDGSVTNARITKSSGNALFDESVLRAVYKSSPLPQPPSAEVFDRDLSISFCSTEDLQC